MGMSLIAAIIIGIVAIVLFIAVVGVAMKLATILVGLILAVFAYMFIEKLVGQGR
jgi:uncharacterized membrane protein YraQ (UPF0718 family)